MNQHQAAPPAQAPPLDPHRFRDARDEALAALEVLRHQIETDRNLVTVRLTLRFAHGGTNGVLRPFDNVTVETMGERRRRRRA